MRAMNALMLGGVLWATTGGVSGQHLAVVDRLERRVMLFDAVDGHLVNANYITTSVGPVGLSTEALQVDNEIWVSDFFSNAVRRFSLDGTQFLGSIVGPFNPPMVRPEGMAYDGTTVYVACSQVLEHGSFAAWVTKLNPNASPAGLFPVTDERHRYDIALDGGALLVTDVDDQALDRHSTGSFTLLERIDSFPGIFGHDPTQVIRLSGGGLALGTTLGLRIYDAGSALIAQHFEGVRVEGVGELGTGELILCVNGSVIAFDVATGEQRTLAGAVNGRFVSEIAGARVCAADVNADGSVTPADFSSWISAFNTGTPQCDQNADGACTPGDFSAWVSHFNAGC